MITATATMIIREGNLFRLMNPEQRERSFVDIARHMQAGNAPQEIQCGRYAVSSVAIGPMESASPRISD